MSLFFSYIRKRFNVFTRISCTQSNRYEQLDFIMCTQRTLRMSDIHELSRVITVVLSISIIIDWIDNVAHESLVVIGQKSECYYHAANVVAVDWVSTEGATRDNNFVTENQISPLAYKEDARQSIRRWLSNRRRPGSIETSPIVGQSSIFFAFGSDFRRIYIRQQSFPSFSSLTLSLRVTLFFSPSFAL